MALLQMRQEVVSDEVGHEVGQALDAAQTFITHQKTRSSRRLAIFLTVITFSI